MTEAKTDPPTSKKCQKLLATPETEEELLVQNLPRAL
jgi:hypothetical protein